MAKILVIDDEAQFVDMITMRLEANGYEIISAENGQLGLEQARSENLDLIILDIMMPVMDGYETLKELRADDQIKNIPVLLCSAKAQQDDVDNGENAGANDFIKKPFESADLLAKIEKLLNTSS